MVKKEQKKEKSELFEWIKALAIAFFLAVIIRFVFLHPLSLMANR